MSIQRKNRSADVEARGSRESLRSVIEVLDRDQCLELLRSTAVARIAFADDGRPVILPITIGMWDAKIVFTSFTGSKLLAASQARLVAIAIDQWNPSTRTGWYVVAHGRARVVDDGREVASLDRLSVTSWSQPEIPKAWVTVQIDHLDGWHIEG